MLSRSTAASRALARSSNTLAAVSASSAPCTSTYAFSRPSSSNGSGSSSAASSSRLYSSAAPSPSSTSSAGAGSLPARTYLAATTQPHQGSLNPAPTPQAVREWFVKALPTLPPLPDDVAAQVITHDSWDLGLTGGTNSGHSRRLSFVGRRALNLFLSLFLSAQRLPLSAAETLLHTAALGERAGATLRLHEVMRWTPARGDGSSRESGLWKIRGTTVEALVGAVYHQFGAATARDFFNAHILPELSIAPSARSAVEAAQAESLAALKRFTGTTSSSSSSHSSAGTGTPATPRPAAPARHADAATTVLGSDSGLRSGAGGVGGAQTNASRSAASSDSWAREAARTQSEHASSI